MAEEPNLYETEFPADEAFIEGDVELECGLNWGLGPLYHGLSWWRNWWRTAYRDPHHWNRPAEWGELLIWD